MKDLNAGVHISPNIQSDSEIYEIENLACDPENKIEDFLESIFDWTGKKVLDIGCGTGFHLPYFSKKADHVFGLEPHDSSRLKALSRIYHLELSNVSVLKGSAESVLLESDSIDFAIARFTYFWGAGSERGLEEVFRVLKPGGFFVTIDNNLDRGTFGSWVKESFSFSELKQAEIEKFWIEQGFAKETIDSSWVFDNHLDFEKVLKIEFPKTYQRILASHKGKSVDYTFNIFYKQKS